MLGKRHLLAVAVLLLATLPAAAADALDLIPADAAIGVGFRNISDLKKKGDKFFAAAGVKEEAFPRPSMMVQQVSEFLGLKAGIDEDAPAAVMVIIPKGSSVKDVGDGGPFVLAVPFKDRDKMAANFDMKGDDLKEGKIFPRNTPGGFFNFGTVFCAHNKHILFANNEKSINAVLVSEKSAAKLLTEAQRKSLADADIQIIFRPECFGEEWTRTLTEMQKHLTDQNSKPNEAERQMASDLVEALKNIRLGLGAIRFDEGLGLSVSAVFPDKVPETTRKFLTLLAGGRTGTDLKGLPDGLAIFAMASKGEGRQNGRLLKVLADVVLRDALDTIDWLPSPTDRLNVLAAFSEIMKRLQAYRIAVYQNPDRIKNGLLSSVAILDTADADKFLADMKLFARLSGSQGLDLSTKGNKEDVAAVEKLIRDLGDDDYEVRESASDRLKLIGEAALPLIDKAFQSKDPEVRRRAEEIKTSIVVAAVARRKDLLSKDAPWRLRPTFQFEAKPEERDGRKIETARIRLTEKDARRQGASGGTRPRLGPHPHRGAGQAGRGPVRLRHRAAGYGVGEPERRQAGTGGRESAGRIRKTGRRGTQIGAAWLGRNRAGLDPRRRPVAR